MQTALSISALACLRVSQASPTKKKLLIYSRSRLNPASLAACRQEDSILERRAKHKTLSDSPIHSTFLTAGGVTQPFFGSRRLTPKGNCILANLVRAWRAPAAFFIFS